MYKSRYEHCSTVRIFDTEMTQGIATNACPSPFTTMAMPILYVCCLQRSARSEGLVRTRVVFSSTFM
jgi:hypothetical protein